MNETALFDILNDLIENLEWAVQRIEHLDHTLQAFQDHQGRTVQPQPSTDAERLGSIRVLRQRVDAIRRELRK